MTDKQMVTKLAKAQRSTINLLKKKENFLESERERLESKQTRMMEEAARDVYGDIFPFNHKINTLLILIVAVGFSGGMLYFDSYDSVLDYELFYDVPPFWMTAVFTAIFFVLFTLSMAPWWADSEMKNYKYSDVEKHIEQVFAGLIMGIGLAIILGILYLLTGIIAFILEFIFGSIVVDFLSGIYLSLAYAASAALGVFMIIHLKNLLYAPFTSQKRSVRRKRELEVLDEYDKKIKNIPQSEHVQNINKKLLDNYEIMNKCDRIPKKYAVPALLDLFKEYFNNGRVDTIKEAINLYEMEKKADIQHQEMMQALQEQRDILKENQYEQKRVYEQLEKDSSKAVDSLQNQEREIKNIKRDLDS